jgi:high-affinity nickel-transport protein
MRHALEPDHLTAVSTLVARERRATRGAWLGAWWGVGHCASLIVIGSALAAFHARMPVRLGAAFELGVAAMLIGLGVRSVVRAVRDGHGCHVHDSHPSTRGARLCSNDHLHIGRWAFATRSLLIGLVHGLAGSGTLVALVAAELPTLPLRVAYIGVFGVGSTITMVVLSGLAGIPLARLSRSPRSGRVVIGTTGAISIAFGVAWALHAT